MPNNKEWEKLKTLLSHKCVVPDYQRLYSMALNEFLAWFQQAHFPASTEATFSAWRVPLEARGLDSSFII